MSGRQVQRQYRTTGGIELATVHDQYSFVTQTFIEHLQRELQEQELSAEVADYGEPNPFPVVTLTCSERVASVIEQMPEVLDIYRDDETSLGNATRANQSQAGNELIPSLGSARRTEQIPTA